MTRRIFSTIIVLICFSLVCRAQKNDSTSLLTRPAHVGLIYPISTNGTSAARYTNRFSLHALAGVSAGETGCAIAGIANIIKDSAAGAQFAGILNLIGGHAESAQFAGILNVVKGKSRGLQAAGLVNKAGSIEGLQVAGLSNTVRSESKGLQVAGLFNKAADVNAQVAGLVNVARKVKGIQLAGLINIADSSDYPIGLINMIGTGEKSIGISTDETLTTLLSLRSGGRVLYGILGLGYNLKSKSDLYALEGGMGGHLRISDRCRVNVEGTQLYLDDFKRGSYFRSSVSVLPGVKIFRRLEIFAGPSISYMNCTNGKGEDLADHYLWSRTNVQGHFQAWYIGATGGLSFIL